MVKIKVNSLVGFRTWSFNSYALRTTTGNLLLLVQLGESQIYKADSLSNFLRNVSWRAVASSFSTTSATLDFKQPNPSRGFGAVYRLKRGQAINKTRYGPLTDLPDFTFLDGRPTPLAPGQKRRLDEKKQMTTVIMKMLQEMDSAETYFKEKQMEEKQQREEILSKKFKPKSS